jgi:GntR family transcriptional repressor for pyruvate dehydrogenase complex
MEPAVQAQRFGRSPRLSAQVIGHLLADVLANWPAGSLLPRETDLAERFGISRGVVREVLRGLEERGVVTVRHGHGAIVNGQVRWDILDPTVLNALLNGPERSSVLLEVLQCRKLLEMHAAELAAARANPEEIEAIAAALDDMRAAADVTTEDGDPFLDADLRFHEALARAAGNRALFRIAGPLQRAFLTAHRPLVHPEARRERSVPEHTAVLEAIRGGDGGAAAAAMERLLATVEGYAAELAED